MSNQQSKPVPVQPPKVGRDVYYFPTQQDRDHSEMQIGEQHYLAAKVVGINSDNDTLLNLIVWDRMGRTFARQGVPFHFRTPQNNGGGHCMYPWIPQGQNPGHVLGRVYDLLELEMEREQQHRLTLPTAPVGPPAVPIPPEEGDEGDTATPPE